MYMRSPLDYNQAIEIQVAVLTRAVDSIMTQMESPEEADGIFIDNLKFSSSL